MRTAFQGVVNSGNFDDTFFFSTSATPSNPSNWGPKSKSTKKRAYVQGQKYIDNCEIRTHALSDHEILVDIDPGDT
jgi:hypothetical protein